MTIGGKAHILDITAWLVGDDDGIGGASTLEVEVTS